MMPKTKLGIWAGGLLVVFVVLFIALIYGMNGWRPGTAPAVIVGFGAMIAGIAAFVTGLVSLVKFKDRSFVVLLAVIIGAIAVLIIIMEVVEGIAWRSTH
jgi:hypothetical protein